MNVHCGFDSKRTLSYTIQKCTTFCCLFLANKTKANETGSINKKTDTNLMKLGDVDAKEETTN